jgi:hypothetical protein
LSGVVLADQAPAADHHWRADAVTQVPGEAPIGSNVLTDLIKAQTEAIKALEARVTQLEARVKKLESPR